jgi:hypothetical protein
MTAYALIFACPLLGNIRRHFDRHQALEMIREALTLGRGINHPSSLVYASMFASSIHTLRGEAQAGLEVADAVIALSREQGFPSWLAAGVFCRGSALAM